MTESAQTTVWSHQRHHTPAFREGKDANTAMDHERFCTKCFDTLPSDLSPDDPCLPTWVVTIEETVHYYHRVQAATADEAKIMTQEQMNSPEWEDPHRSDVQGQEILTVELG